MAAQMMAISAEVGRERIYLPPNDEHEAAAKIDLPLGLPETELPNNPRAFTAPNYGMKKHTDLFTNRQLTALSTLGDLIDEATFNVAADARKCDRDAQAYANAVITYLAITLGRLADIQNGLCTWLAAANKVVHLFSRQAITMTWDFAEAGLFGGAAGDYAVSLSSVAKVIARLSAKNAGTAEQADASTRSYAGMLISTDPPYYDNVPYADLSDFFYLWLRRSLRRIYPELFSTMLTPKAAELVADPYRQGGKEESEQFFREGFEQVFRAMGEAATFDYPIAVFYAFKQAESTIDGSAASTGWDTLLEGMIRAGWMVTGTWPIQTERQGRVREMGFNALASSIVLACRVRHARAGTRDMRGFRAELRAGLPEALRKLQQGNIAPVDLAQAAIGPGMAVFSRYERVTAPDGSPLPVRQALSIINDVLDEVLAEQEGDFDTDTRWCVKWFEEFRWDEGHYGRAETLATATNTSMRGLERAGVVRARGGKVALFSPEQLPSDYDPETDVRPTVWEATLHLSRLIEEQSVEAGGAFLAKVARTRVDVDAIRELAYRLYNICERKDWAQTGLRFNNLVTSWPDLQAAGGKARRGLAAPEQQSLTEAANEDE
jgi:putative DNA methylase